MLVSSVKKRQKFGNDSNDSSTSADRWQQLHKTIKSKFEYKSAKLRKYLKKFSWIFEFGAVSVFQGFQIGSKDANVFRLNSKG